MCRHLCLSRNLAFLSGSCSSLRLYHHHLYRRINQSWKVNATPGNKVLLIHWLGFDCNFLPLTSQDNADCAQCSSFILALSGTLYVIFRPEFRPWAFTLSFNYIRSLCAFSSAALLFVLCALYAVSFCLASFPSY